MRNTDARMLSVLGSKIDIATLNRTCFLLSVFVVMVTLLMMILSIEIQT